jgi:thiol-disulfide isomerase/thioredoxin
MKRLVHIFITIFVVVILLFTAFFVFNNLVKKEVADKEAPSIDSITGDTTGTTGKITTIIASFSDNEEVTEAIIYYKPASAKDWSSNSIINGSYDIHIAKKPIEDWYYYITIDDAAGTGPVGSPSVDGSIFYIISVKEDKKELVHNVFIEEGTATWCHNCPKVADILHELYESGDYNFYYVSLIQDKNSIAKNRLEKDYNIYGYPTVYIDGGYDVVLGEKDKAFYEEKISKAQLRDVPELYLNVTAELKEGKKDVDVSVEIINYENYTYNGRLKLYLTEINSYQYYGGQGVYHFGLIDIIYDREIKLLSKDDRVISQVYDFSDYDVDNLMVVAVIFKSEPVEKYSGPDKESPFNAYYADAAQGALVVEDGNLRPEVGITNPKKGRLHIFGREITATMGLRTILFGRTPITIYASDDSKVEKVELYINGVLVKEFTDEPYEYMWKRTKLFRPRHEIKVIAYDDQGKTSEEKMDVLAFMFL